MARPGAAGARGPGSPAPPSRDDSRGLSLQLSPRRAPAPSVRPRDVLMRSFGRCMPAGERAETGEGAAHARVPRNDAGGGWGGTALRRRYRTQVVDT